LLDGFAGHKALLLPDVMVGFMNSATSLADHGVQKESRKYREFHVDGWHNPAFTIGTEAMVVEAVSATT
jgi:hypothetical protein